MQRGLVGDLMQPVRHHFPGQDGRRLAGEDEESGLERILGVVMREESATDPPHHRAMALDKAGEGSVVAVLDEAPQELPIGHPGPVLQKHRLAKVLNDQARQLRRHVVSQQVSAASIYYLPQGGTLMQVFFQRGQNGTFGMP
jgi:hypothetical protein